MHVHRNYRRLSIRPRGTSPARPAAFRSLRRDLRVFNCDFARGGPRPPLEGPSAAARPQHAGAPRLRRGVGGAGPLIMNDRRRRRGRAAGQGARAVAAWCDWAAAISRTRRKGPMSRPARGPAVGYPRIRDMFSDCHLSTRDTYFCIIRRVQSPSVSMLSAASIRRMRLVQVYK